MKSAWRQQPEKCPSSGCRIQACSTKQTEQTPSFNSSCWLTFSFVLLETRDIKQNQSIIPYSPFPLFLPCLISATKKVQPRVTAAKPVERGTARWTGISAPQHKLLNSPDHLGCRCVYNPLYRKGKEDGNQKKTKNQQLDTKLQDNTVELLNGIRVGQYATSAHLRHSPSRPPLFLFDQRQIIASFSSCLFFFLFHVCRRVDSPCCQHSSSCACCCQFFCRQTCLSALPRAHHGFAGVEDQGQEPRRWTRWRWGTLFSFFSWRSNLDKWSAAWYIYIYICTHIYTYI